MQQTTQLPGQSLFLLMRMHQEVAQVETTIKGSSLNIHCCPSAAYTHQGVHKSCNKVQIQFCS